MCTRRPKANRNHPSMKHTRLPKQCSAPCPTNLCFDTVCKTVYSALQMCDMIYASVLIFLLSAIGILGVKVADGAPLLIPLLVGAIVWRIVLQRKLARPLKEMSMHTAADLDRQDLV